MAAGADSRVRHKLRLDPDEALRAAVERTLAVGVDAISNEQPAAAAGQVEPIHQFRVAIRRLRAAIDLFATAMHATQVRILKRDLGWCASQAGVVRECDVVEQIIGARGGRIEPSLTQSLQEIFHWLSARRRAEQENLGATLESKRYLALIARLAKPALRKLPEATLESAAPALLQPMVRATIRAGTNLSEDAPTDAFHRLRIRVKRLRFAVELLSQLGGKRMRKAARRLEDLQELLGTYNDVAVAITYLHLYAGSEGARPEAVLAAGELIHSLVARQRKLGRRSLKAFKRFERAGISADMLIEARSTVKEQRAHVETGAESAA